MNTPVAVTLSTDDKYTHAVAVAMWSVLSKSAARIDFHILDNELSDQSRGLIERVAAHFPNAQVFFYPIPEALKAFTTSGPVRGTLARLLIPELLPHVPRVIYLDADILAERDIAELFNAELDGALIGVISNFRTVEKQCVAKSPLALFYPKMVAAAHKERARLLRDTGRGDPENYINAGIFLLDNAAVLREPDIARRLMDFQSASTKGMKDQDWLFHVFEGRMKHLHPRWNCYWSIGRANFWAFAPAERRRFLEARDDPGIIHFVGTNPWAPMASETFTAGAQFRARWRQAAEAMNAAVEPS